MPRTITIKNLKGIKNLAFEFPNQNGVYLLVGPNGVGKTTLLICMDRICNPQAFARGFYQPNNVAGYDEYSNSKIEYQNGTNKVVFRKKRSKWSATPRKDNAAQLHSFGFSNSIFIKADSKRIDAKQDEIQRGKVRPADPNIVRILNEIFETTKYKNLQQLTVSPQRRGRPSAHFNIIQDGSFYYTEKRFSTGELAILHLIQFIEKNAINGAIILLDEAEIALHPRVQINLLKYLQSVSESKDLMVVISTHSPTMIKTVTPEQILLLDSDRTGNVSIKTPCYPAQALGRVDYEESAGFDFIFFVEDDIARLFLKKLINRYIRLVPEHSTSSTSIVPVGGFYQTAQLSVTTKEQLFNKSKVFALLDSDAFDNLDQKPLFKPLFEANKKTVRSLTITPEVKFIEVFTSETEDVIRAFREQMHCEPSSIINSLDYIQCNSPKPRQLAKARFETFVLHCCKTSGDNEDYVKNVLIDIVINSYSEGEIKQILGPIFNA